MTGSLHSAMFLAEKTSDDNGDQQQQTESAPSSSEAADATAGIIIPQYLRSDQSVTGNAIMTAIFQFVLFQTPLFFATLSVIFRSCIFIRPTECPSWRQSGTLGLITETHLFFIHKLSPDPRGIAPATKPVPKESVPSTRMINPRWPMAERAA